MLYGKKSKEGGAILMYGKYKTEGRGLLIEMAANKEEEVMILYQWIKKDYSYLLGKQFLSEGEIRRYNSLVDANVYNAKLKAALMIR